MWRPKILLKLVLKKHQILSTELFSDHVKTETISIDRIRVSVTDKTMSRIEC